MTKDIIRSVIEMLAVACRPKRSPNELLPEHTLIGDLGVDSLAFMEIVITVENQFKIMFDDEYLTIEAFERLGDLTAYIDTKVAA
jgi:acyl carrier protein